MLAVVSYFEDTPRAKPLLQVALSLLRSYPSFSTTSWPFSGIGPKTVL